jgi:hypothetical protein
VASTTSTSYTDLGLPTNTMYYYKVSAYNSSYVEGSLSSYTYATTSSTSTISLSYNTWYPNTLSAGGTHYYSFYASSGTTYYVYWEDRDYDSSSYGDIRVSATNSSGTYLFDHVDSGYNGVSFYVSSSGYVTLTVVGYNSSSSGSYRIKYDY